MSSPQAEAERQAAKQEVLDRFTAMAEGYSTWVLDRPFAQGLFDRFVSELEPELSGRQGAQVLDVASASGEPGATLAAALPHATVHATDVCPAFVELGRKRAARLGLPNLVCEQADAEALSQYSDSSMDAVTCCMGIMFMPHVEAALAEFFRVLKPGGRLVVSVYQGMEAQPFYPFAQSLAEEICSQAGCSSAESQQEQQEQQQEPELSPYNACRFGDPAPLLAAVAAAGLGHVECQELAVSYFMSAVDWWPCLSTMPDMPIRDALVTAQAAAGDSRDVGIEARQLAERRLAEQGWLQEDGSVCCRNNMAWLISARKA